MRGNSKAKVIGVLVLAILIVTVVVGGGLYYLNKDSVRGAFFRKMYGSIGVTDGGKNYVRFSLFCFNTDSAFLASVENCKLNGGVTLEDIVVEEETRESDLVVYNVDLGVSLPAEGQFDVTEFIYDNGTEKEVFPLGKISFVNVKENPLFLDLGMDTQIVDGSVAYTFKENLGASFAIEDVIFANDPSVVYQYEKDCVYSPSEGLKYTINIDYSVGKGDLFVVQPIFKLTSSSKEFTGAVVPIMLAYSGEDMTYMEIKEYVK